MGPRLDAFKGEGMRGRRKGLVLAGAVAVCILPACATGRFRADAFREAPTLALVRVCIDDRVLYVDGHGEALVAPIEASTAGVAEPSMSALRSALAGSRRFRLLEGPPVLEEEAAPDTNAGSSAWRCHRAPGFVGRDRAAAARALGAGGTITLKVQLGYIVDGVSLAGVWNAGLVHGRAVLHVSALDASGESVWSDDVVATSPGSFPGTSHGVDGARLAPVMVEAARAAIDTLLERLDSRT